MNQKETASQMQETSSSFFYSLIFILIISSLVIAGLSLFITKRMRSARLGNVPEAIRNIRLTWGQELKHNMVLYFVPILILVLPFFSNQLPDFTDFLQAAMAFIGLSYLKNLYWGKFI